MSPRGLNVAVLGVNYAPEKSGIAPYTAGMARGLQAVGHSVRVLTSYPHYPHWQVKDGVPAVAQECFDGVPITRLRHYVPSEPTGARRARFEASFGARLVTSRWGSPDVVICVSPALISSAMAIGKARSLRRRPAIGLVIQDLYSRGVEETGLGGGSMGSMAASFEGRVARAADGVAVIHNRFKEQVVRNLGVESDRVHVIRNWTHISPVPDFDTQGFRASLGWRPDEVVVLHSGAMGAKQALENVIAAARIAEHRGDAVRFVLLGDGSQRRALQSLASGARMVQFLDPLDSQDFGRALVAADILLVNERSGVKDMAVPSKLTSYFSSGRPVLAATDPGSTTAEEIAASNAGIRVDADAPLQLVDAAIRLGHSEDECQALGKNGVRYCAEVLSQESAVRKYDQWVRHLSALRHRSG